MSDSLQPHWLQPASSSVHGILQTRILEWVAIPFSRNPPDQGIKPTTRASLVLAGRFFFLPLAPPAAAAKSLQSCPTLCDPIDGSPPGSHIPGILQARTLEWVAISFSNAWKWKVKVKSLSCVRLFPTPWKPGVFPPCSLPGPPSMGFSRQEYWSGVPSPSPPRKPQISKYGKLINFPCRRTPNNLYRYCILTEVELLTP